MAQCRFNTNNKAKVHCDDKIEKSPFIVLPRGKVTFDATGNRIFENKVHTGAKQQKLRKNVYTEKNIHHLLF